MAWHRQVIIVHTEHCELQCATAGSTYVTCNIYDFAGMLKHSVNLISPQKSKAVTAEGLLHDIGYKQGSTLADGHCMYRSIAESMGKNATISDVQELRNMAAVQVQAANFLHFHARDAVIGKILGAKSSHGLKGAATADWQEVNDKMLTVFLKHCKGKWWGGEVEVKALAMAMGRKIVVIGKAGYVIEVRLFTPEGRDFNYGGDPKSAKVLFKNMMMSTEEHREQLKQEIEGAFVIYFNGVDHYNVCHKKA